MTDRFIEEIEGQIALYESLLVPLKAGKFRIGESTDDGRSWTDRTKAQIDHLEGLVRMLKLVVERG